VVVTVDGKGDALSVDASSSSSSSHVPFLVNVTAQPAAVLAITALEPLTLSLTSYTLLNLSLKNLPGFVMTDHSGEVPYGTTSSYSQISHYYSSYSQSSTVVPSSLYTGDVTHAAAAAAAADAASSTDNCKSWLSLSIARVECPILSCSGSAAAALVAALFPGQEVEAAAVDASGQVSVTLLVAHAAGSAVVTRRRLAALMHPPLVHVPKNSAATATAEAAAAEKVADFGILQQLQPQQQLAHHEDSGRLQQLIEGVRDSASAVAAAAGSAILHLWTKYVQAQRERQSFRERVRLQGALSRHVHQTVAGAQTYFKCGCIACLCMG
jgi:hypothetical protein